MAEVSAWAKPGAWALDAEEHEAELQQKDKGYDSSDSNSHPYQEPSADFPSLATAAAASKTSKKKKGQRLSLAEFTTGNAVTHGAGRFQSSSSSKGLTSDEHLVLPTGPRERTAEELERSSRGFGYSSYGGSAGGRGRISGEESYSRWGSSRVSDEARRGGYGGAGTGSNRDLGPSRADEIDDWGAAKKSVVPERKERGGGFFDSQSRADESDSWISNKSAAPPSDGRRMNVGGFDGPRERRGGFDMFNREGSNGGPDSDAWGKKREDVSSSGRPRLVLQPRTLPLADGSNGELSRREQPMGSMEKSKGSNPFGEARPREEVLAEKGQDWKKIEEKLEARSVDKSRVLNPFGVARPREEVLAEKGQDWKKIDEKLGAMKIWEAPPESSSSGKRGLGIGNGTGSLLEDRTERSWRKADTSDSPPPRAEKVEEGLPEN
ncbi:eukaryotic translation initiation factor 4B3 [Elaeis guineensis]|uniref:eukaryotic translation initiation factor 4B3 n=1 Tax=Elaeis guineensis var. tenera TaxID=51953 RepID=UPI003C6D0310